MLIAAGLDCFRINCAHDGPEVWGGQASRAEVTGAAMSQRADCVMLDKGPQLVEAVQFLRGILARMDRHQAKKSPKAGTAQIVETRLMSLPACPRPKKPPPSDGSPPHRAAQGLPQSAAQSAGAGPGPRDIWDFGERKTGRVLAHSLKA